MLWARTHREEEEKCDVVSCYRCCSRLFVDASSVRAALMQPKQAPDTHCALATYDSSYWAPLWCPEHEQISWEAPQGDFCRCAKLSEEFIQSTERKLVAVLSGIYVILSSLWKFWSICHRYNFVQSLQRTSWDISATKFLYMLNDTLCSVYLLCKTNSQHDK